jgi:hypothetical protein
MGLSFLERIAMGAVRGFLNGAIGKFTPAELQKAIDENKDLWGVTPSWMKSTGHIMKGTYGDAFKKYFDNNVDTQLILTWLSYDQPNLYAVIQPDPFMPPRKKEYDWLNNQIKKIKEEIKKL